ncbi:MAG: hypothetical protein CVU13_10405 [Bacteroidetes bacterium HGW-Bacteroidetes-8]|nr:MAG: hypothetical protein CVU13_10405 [Bacteroidetes bacterium HGW-Bacteroidetes-8]
MLKTLSMKNFCRSWCLFLFTMIFSVSLFAQNEKITLDIKSSPARAILKEIEKQCTFTFVFSGSTINSGKITSLKVSNERLEDVLKNLCKEINCEFSFVGKQIILAPLKERKESTPQQNVVKNQTATEIKGKITDDKDMPLPGAYIKVKDSNVAVVSDNNGNYQIKYGGGEITLVVSYIGFQTQEMKVRNQSVANITLFPEENQLEDAVVIGYGSVKKKDLTGSVVRITEKSIENTSFTDIGRIIQGQVSGMEIISGNGRPGDQVKIRIRGETSLQGESSPLIVIDEIPMPDDYDINLINPNDIQSIDVLKGASAAAIYGSKGSAGVILITTKRGKEDSFEVFYNGNVSTDQYIQKIKGLTAEDYKQLVASSILYNYEYQKQINPNVNKDIRTATEWGVVAVSNYFGNADTDWTDVLTRTPINTNNTVGIRGGTKTASYYASFGLTKNTGKIIGNENKRITGNFKLDLRPSKFLDIGFRVNGTNTNTLTALSMSQVYQMRPDIPAYDEAGNYYRFWSTGHNRYLDNPVQMAKEAPTKKREFRYNIDGYARINFSKNLRYQFTYSFAESRYESSNYQGSYTYAGSGGYYRGVNGILDVNNGYTTQETYDNSLNYTKDFKNQELAFMVGSSFNRDTDGYVSQNYQNFPDDYIQNAIYNATKWNYSNGSDDASAYYSFYSRLNYKYKEKYIVTGTVRRDASSKFAPAYRAGTFPSFAVAWVMSEEKFLKSNSIELTFLKLRAGWGVTGNNRIGRYSWRTMFDTSNYFDLPGSIPISIGNNLIKWEETRQIDIALDYGFWKNRITGTLGVYNKITDGLLFGFTLPLSAGVTSVNTNMAKIENKGIEFDIRAQLLEDTKWGLNVGFNISANRGKVLDMDKEIVGSAFGGTSLGSTVLKIGEPVGLIYGYRIAGIMSDPKEALLISQKEVGNYAGYGRYYYKDLNEDGKIDALYDREVIGKTQPDFYGGFNIDFRYKRLTARMMGKFSYGAQKHWSGMADQFHSNLYNPSNTLEYALYGWTPSYPNTNLQRFGAGWEKGVADNYIFDASYLKITDLTIGYDLPSNFVTKMGLSSVNIYGAVNNVITFTSYPGTNVEASTTATISGGAQDYTVYPLSRTFTLGLKFMFR